MQVEELLWRLVEQRPQLSLGDERELAPEDLLNLHLTCREVFELCREPSCLAMASELLGTEDLSVFTSRVLCKMPKTGKEIPWHQDSNYWPLTGPENCKAELTSEDVDPKVASLWLALDDVTDENGPMEVLTFEDQPESSHQNVPMSFVLDAGGSTKGFENFNLSLDASKLNATRAKRLLLRRGEAEFHSAHTIHRSEANKSDRRRMAWIVRYCPRGTRVVPGLRASFDGYPIVPLQSDFRPPYEAREALERKREVYAPCFGNAAAELKK